jgi:tetratricopeptide (TPR) repeat protein
LFFFKGVDLRKAGKDDEAMESYRKSIPYNDKNVFLFNEMSVIFSNRKQYDSSLYYLKMAYNMDATSLLIIENIAAVSFLNKNYPQAIEYANKALAINANSKKSYGVLADTYRAMGNNAEAAKNQERYNQIK